MIATALIGTTINSGTKTYNLNFLKKINNKSFEEKIIVFITKSYLDEEKKNLNRNIKYIIKSNILILINFRLFGCKFLLPFEIYLNIMV